MLTFLWLFEVKKLFGLGNYYNLFLFQTAEELSIQAYRYKRMKGIKIISNLVLHKLLHLIAFMQMI